jgi:tight adherence protein C
MIWENAMTELLETLSLQFGISSQNILLIGVGIGIVVLFHGIASLFNQRDTVAERIAATASGRKAARRDRGLLRASVAGPRGLMKPFILTDAEQRTALQRKLVQAGLTGSNAMRNYTFARIGLGLALPGILIALIMLGRVPGLVLPLDLSGRAARMSNMQILQLLSILVTLGYFLPAIWLRGRVQERRQRIEEAFPNALDLMQISVEAGLGFDAAMTRVGNELTTVSPDIAFEFLSTQLQVQAGKPRDAAMHDMALRTGVEMVQSFASVVQQSMQFGTSMSEALTTYATEMRAYREMRAQEMANKLPVKMSAVLASLMLPALVLLTIGPVIIRYVRYFAN